MSTTTQTTQTSTGFIGLRAVVNDPNFVAVALFSALGLLASLYFMTHFSLPVEDATFLTSWL
jgi:hypothetical protein